MALSSALREAARQQKEANQAKGSKMRNLKSLIGFSHKKAPESSPQQAWPLTHELNPVEVKFGVILPIPGLKISLKW